jgi:beta-lactamase class A
MRVSRRSALVVSAAAVVVAGILIAALRPWSLVGRVSATQTPTASASAAVQTATPTPAPTPSPTPSPTPLPTPAPTQGWIASSTAVLATAGDAATAQAHLGAGFPVLVDAESASVEGVVWRRVEWQTPGRSGVGWVAAAKLTDAEPEGAGEADIDALDVDLAGYLAALGDRVGLRVVDLTRGIAYGDNAGRSYTVASSIKVPIMLAFLTQLEARHREPTDAQLDLLTAMIEHSDNDAATTLYAAVGTVAGMDAFMKSVGVSGLRPQTAIVGWGWSTITPRAMASLLELLQQGAILTPTHRALALDLMEHVIPEQRFGVGDTAPDGATVALKTGFVTTADGLLAVNSSGIVTVGSETYVISVYTVGNASLEEGLEIVNHACAAVADVLP